MATALLLLLVRVFFFFFCACLSASLTEDQVLAAARASASLDPLASCQPFNASTCNGTIAFGGRLPLYCLSSSSDRRLPASSRIHQQHLHSGRPGLRCSRLLSYDFFFFQAQSLPQHRHSRPRGFLRRPQRLGLFRSDPPVFVLRHLPAVCYLQRYCQRCLCWLYPLSRLLTSCRHDPASVGGLRQPM